MSIFARRKTKTVQDYLPFPEQHYRDVKRKHLIRLILIYLAPLILLSIYFLIQYGALDTESRRSHLRAIAENQANTLDLFLTERIVNLSNLVDDPRTQFPPASEVMQTYLERLKRSSEAFVDIGYFDSSGVQAAYAGPYPSLEKRNYSSEAWYMSLKEHEDDFIITDIYLGFRRKPHFTIAVSRTINNQFVVWRATLDPEKIYEYIRSLEGSHEVYTSIVNKDGYYQLVTPRMGTPLEASSFVPPVSPRLGAEKAKIKGSSFLFAYSWLRRADWALIVQRSGQEEFGILSGLQLRILGISAALVVLIFIVIVNRAGQLVEIQKESDKTRAQLEHAAKLASVGELAAGIAHEINNPLAAINEEAGLMKDLMSPEYDETISEKEITSHLDSIQELVFRCRDITRKLLGFVRRTDMDLKLHDINRLIDGVVDGILGEEMAVSNIEIVRNYAQDLPRILTDGNQLQQVLLNMLNNSADAIDGHPGRITISTSRDGNSIRFAIADTGAGMTPEQMEKIFLPFYTTKQVGRGTGLGLSVSYGIIKSLGGKIEVESAPGKGSKFVVTLPIRSKTERR
jgi:two-component system NtrC family sensor kinase